MSNRNLATKNLSLLIRLVSQLLRKAAVLEWVLHSLRARPGKNRATNYVCLCKTARVSVSKPMPNHTVHALQQFGSGAMEFRC